MKRLLVLVLVVALFAGSMMGCNDNEVDPETSTALVVGGSLFESNEGFIHGFGNSSADNWVKTILHHHYSTYVVTENGEIVLNSTVVKNKDVTVDEAGNKTYTFEIHDDLQWNNGRAITAQDYVFSVLWSGSKEWADTGATSDIGKGLLGYSDYHEGADHRFAGVRLLDEFKFSLTIAASELPNFYETTFVSVHPSYKEGWSYFSKVDSNSDGAKLTSNSSDWTLAFDTKRIAQTERYAPTVTSGPFTFVSFENNIITLAANPMFKGDHKGQKPQLDYVIIKNISEQFEVENCINGEVDAINGVMEDYKIESALASSAVEVTSFHPRNGFGGMFFHCDYGPTQYKEVRQALAYLLDRQELIKEFYGDNSFTVNGLYGRGQWMYLENKAAIDALPSYELNVAKANELLDQTPYKFEADGKTAFDAAKTSNGSYYRHDAQGERLVINHVDSESGNLNDPIPSQLLANAPLAGIDWQAHRLDFSNILSHYYNGSRLPQGQRLYHSFSLATNFSTTFDPFSSYHIDAQHNYVRLSDPELDEIMVRMRSLDPGKGAVLSRMGHLSDQMESAAPHGPHQFQPLL